MSLTKGSGIGFAKVLIAGGYLILEPENRGLSLCYSSANIETTLLVSEESSTNDDLHTISINVTNITFPEESKNYVLEITGDHPEIFKNTKLFMKRFIHMFLSWNIYVGLYI